MATLPTGTYPAYHSSYIKLVDTDNINDAIAKYSNSIVDFFEGIPEEKVAYRYAEGKWSLKEMLQHIIDAERVFGYRAVCISRGETTALPGFDENSYADNSNAEKRDWNSLIEELKAVRLSTDLLLRSFTEEMLDQQGITNGQPNTPRAIAFVIFGHALHHINIVKERYLTA